MTMLDLLLASQGTTREAITQRRGGALPGLLRIEGVGESDELNRVLSLPRRMPCTEEEIELLSAYFRLREYDDIGQRNML